MEVKPGLWDPQKCPFPLNRGVLSIEVTVTKIMWTFFRHHIFVSLEWRCPLNRGVPMERFHCSRDKQNRKNERKRKKAFRDWERKGSSPQSTFEFLVFFFYLVRFLVLAFRIVPSDRNRQQAVAGADVQLAPEGCQAVVGRGHLLFAKGKVK